MFNGKGSSRHEESGGREPGSRSKARRATPEGMRLQLAGLCARSEQNEYELRQKMKRKGLSDAEIDGVIEFLKQGGYLDERRFARAYASDKVRFSGWGMAKIRQGLMQKHVPREIISEALESIERKEYIAALKRTGIAKARTVDITTAEGKAKFYRHLMGRGFESNLIGKLADAIVRKISSDRNVESAD